MTKVNNLKKKATNFTNQMLGRVAKRKLDGVSRPQTLELNQKSSSSKMSADHCRSEVST